MEWNIHFLWKNTSKIFPGSGMIRAFRRAVSQQNSTSRGQPRLRQVWILITSFCFSSQMRINSSPGMILWKICKIYASPIIDTFMCIYFIIKNKFSNDLLIRKGESSVRCPFCNQDNTRVVDSRPVEDTIPSAAAVSVMPAESVLQLMRRWKRFR